MANLADALTKIAAEHPNGIAIKLDDVELPYAALDGMAAHVAGLLVERGVEPGDRVGIMLPNVPYFPAIYYGILKAGAAVVPMNVLLKGREAEFYLSDSGAKQFFAWEGFAEEAEIAAEAAGVPLTTVTPGEFEQIIAAAAPLQENVPRAGDDTCVILYTSGTTGTPKGAELTHSNIGSNVATNVEMFGFTPDDVIFGGLPLFHSFGQTCAMNAGIASGATVTLLPRFDAPKALEIIDRDKVTVFMGVPTMYVGMLHDPGIDNVDASTLRFCVSGGASLPVEVLTAVENKLDAKMLEGYGLSETSPVASFNHPEKPSKPGSIGLPLPGVEMKLIDDDGNDIPEDSYHVGEIAIKGPNVMKGYWNRPEATAEVMRGDWFLSGDMGQRDEDGYYFIVDRKKELIIRGGYNVYPREVEEVLYEHPAVMEVAVIGVKDATHGEEVAAAIGLKPGETATAEEIQAFAKERVAAYKYPRHIWFVDALPKTATGKILKREIEVPAGVAN
ncbi:MAG: long-chain fatty acid--CoA ligase [Solirubrobacteraceae bacterium]|nr:long-chain fatty acid--CoA ligase [Solirubrobacteraceae bacterium]